MQVGDRVQVQDGDRQVFGTVTELQNDNRIIRVHTDGAKRAYLWYKTQVTLVKRKDSLLCECERCR